MLSGLAREAQVLRGRMRLPGAWVEGLRCHRKVVLQHGLRQATLGGLPPLGGQLLGGQKLAEGSLVQKVRPLRPSRHLALLAGLLILLQVPVLLGAGHTGAGPQPCREGGRIVGLVTTHLHWASRIDVAAPDCDGGWGGVKQPGSALLLLIML